MDGYDNLATNSNDTDALDTPLPSGLNMTFLDCLNQTIGASAPIEDNDANSSSAPRLQPSAFFSTIWLIVVLARAFIF